MHKSKVKQFILETINKQGVCTTADIIDAAGFTRSYINRFLKELREEGRIVLIGKANRARYVFADRQVMASEKSKVTGTRKILVNNNLSEDLILEQIKNDTGIFIGVSKSFSELLDYAFTEILNNAIEHSQSGKIEIRFDKQEELVKFEIIDFGIGIFNNIMKKRHLKSEIEAVQDLLKGKQTTVPKSHSGEGIFFTSKVADAMTIASSRKKITFNNIIDDIFIQDIKKRLGTKVIFSLSINTNKKLEEIFRVYTDKNYVFSKTKVTVKLYQTDVLYVSRSQARRLLIGLQKFKHIVLDFKNVDTIGQAFADEIFRVWNSKHLNIMIEAVNTNENIDLMIQKAKEKR